MIFVECVCPQEIALQRLTQRWKQRTQGSLGQQSDEEALRASDGRPDLYGKQKAVWEPFSAEQEPNTTHIAVDTARPLAVNREQVFELLRLPHSACWL